MIDFQNASVFKLSKSSDEDAYKLVGAIFADGEQLIAAFKSVRDRVVFTNKRVICVNIQGLTGKKMDFTSLPYSKVQVYSIETGGTFDLDCEMQLYFSTVGKVTFEFTAGQDIRQINSVISNFIL